MGALRGQGFKAGAAMLIRVRELELRNLEFDENFQPGAIEFGPDFARLGHCTVQAGPIWWLSTVGIIRMLKTSD